MRHRIFITSLTSPEMVVKLNMSIAACNFSRNLMSGGIFDITYSILPPFVKGKLNKKIVPNDAELIYSKYRTKSNPLCKILSLLDENFQIFKRINSCDSIWYYNLCMVNVTLFICIKLLKPTVKQNVIVLDYTPSPRRCSLLNLYKWLFNHAHSNILLAPYHEFTNKNSACLPGVVSQKNIEYPKIQKLSNSFLISGTLKEDISLLRTLLLPAFKRMPDMILHICGNCNNDNIMEEYKSCSNIIFHGKLTSKEYLDVLHSVTYVLSTRDSKSVENQCNFPSKIIEALLHNRAIISTICYPQLDTLRYFKVSSSIVGFIDSINTIVSKDEKIGMLYVNQAERIIKKFSTEVWRETMIRLEKNG